MVVFALQKLVRDKLVEIYIGLGQKPRHHFLGKDDHKMHLAHKIVEEAKELSNASTDKMAEEIADVRQALDDLQYLYGISDTELARVMKAKKAKKGGFRKGLFIDRLELEDGDPWIEYYRKEPERFPEIQPAADNLEK